ncbi:MAG: 4-hydroxyphenylpyruvate dioxygenase [Drouetiella hepatica Uher 2000/2452]|jgi:4-hydroxyphenylpyruvate dioxygenase|uniref:4-hydroxyphenylpyruvate dioxygenase n=1 Tax=Drouetiella hepatica Uher 2000/2452 TaxID=904376 RepID=A0A951QJU9_9CYAN|nr:4-hydroxyphenylpyruvate dioxygenase [Drouetiella hepatica Uher 2000/2452]
MNLDHVHFYVADAVIWRNWFVQKLGFQPIAHLAGSGIYADFETQTEIVQSGKVCIFLSSAKTAQSPVARYLQKHPAGVADVAFQVENLEMAIAQAVSSGAKVTQLPQVVRQPQRIVKSAQIQGWGDLRHTLVEPLEQPEESLDPGWITEFDHVVLNVAAGELRKASAWYEQVFGFQRQQTFEIQTDRSALCSQVLTHPAGSAQLPINEPTSSGSQIQEFLNANRGTGIQHIALQTSAIVEAIAQFRRQGLSFLSVPFSYYEALRQRPGFSLSAAEWQAIAHQEVLVDWQKDLPQALLLQAFTQPIFPQPTFFFELIERRKSWVNKQCHQAKGFGEGNFRALFEAIEREQMKRGSLL